MKDTSYLPIVPCHFTTFFFFKKEKEKKIVNSTVMKIFHLWEIDCYKHLELETPSINVKCTVLCSRVCFLLFNVFYTTHIATE